MRAVGGVVAVLATAGALLLSDHRVTSEDTPEVEVLGRVEQSSLPPAAAADPVIVTVPPTSTVAPPPTSAASTPDTTVSPLATTAPLPTPAAVAPSPEDRARQAIAEIDYPWQSRFPSWTIDIGPARSGVRALTYPDQQRVELFPRRDDTVVELRRILAHELGHVADLELNDEADRQRWRDARGVGSAVPWWPDGTSFDFDTLAGDFAEGFAAWLEGASSQSRVGGALTGEQLALVGELVG